MPRNVRALHSSKIDRLCKSSISPKVAAEFANKVGYSSKQFVRLCLQDLLNREGVYLSVDIEDAA